MKQPKDKDREVLHLLVVQTAQAGDAGAMEQILRYYEGYICKLCTRKLYDKNGCPHVCLDEYMKRRLEIKLISAILAVN